MFSSIAKAARAASSLMLLLAATGLGISCAASSPQQAEEPTAKELNAPLVEAPEIELMNEGKRLFKDGLYTLASQNFMSLKDGYPDGPYQDFARLKLGDSLFFSSDFEGAEKVFAQFIESSPGSPYLDYAKLMVSKSILSNVSSEVGKDASPYEKIVATLEDFATKHPQSPYLKEALKYQEMSLEKILAYEDTVNSFYEGSNYRQERIAKIAKKLSKAQQDNEQLAARLARQEEVPPTLRARFAPASRKPSRTLSRAHSQRSSRKTRAVLDSQGIGFSNISNPNDSNQRDYPAEDPEMIESKVDNPKSSMLPPSNNRITAVECIKSKNQEIINFNLENAADDDIPRILMAEDGVLNLDIPAAAIPSFTTCFDTHKIVISSNGQVSISGYELGRVLVMDNPYRVMVLVK